MSDVAKSPRKQRQGWVPSFVPSGSAAGPPRADSTFKKSSTPSGTTRGVR
ncbi:predicted protein [Plenodomus lingam JN3]|uniref:Uncharacterized protein n=1 Tax=Leptosphaeria maculans (strain JN3 / isolate v23.1.3 / race Av1-4-5-6-7-8) TaxID=985895 RepID=E5A5U2_LEPMJ|nr:predicted protein [Plenodomus lingam JN3]CBX98987.1 predicted protein [Plenodomus lingam JN3]